MNIVVKAPSREYPILIKKGLLNEIVLHIKSGNNFVITNKTVYNLYGKLLEPLDAKFIFMGDGEEFKNIATYEKIMDELLSYKIERSSKIIALGGGIVGDIAGFAAATILRGVDFIQVPTTLLAQVDSSIGGKTGFNTKYGKNLIGAFYQPKIVLIDPNTISTLDNRQIKTGLAEIVKYAFIEKTATGESALFKFLENKIVEENYPEIILKSCSIKSNVVCLDEKESGLRAILNFGHTFGHAYEKATNYTKITHGEGVILGIRCAFKLALEIGLIDEQYYKRSMALLKNLGLDVGAPKIAPEILLDAMRNDKKVKNSKITFVLPNGESEVILNSDIDEPLIIKSLL